MVFQIGHKINIGKNHGLWKGDAVGYRALHNWVLRHKPKVNFCENCGKLKKLELSNISGNYKRDIDDYFWLCSKCHHKKDYEFVVFKRILIKSIRS